MAGIKYLFGGATHYNPATPLYFDPKWLVDNDWRINLAGATNALLSESTGGVDALITAIDHIGLNLIVENDIKFLLNLNVLSSWVLYYLTPPQVNPDASFYEQYSNTILDFEAIYGPSGYDVLVGYWYEEAWDNGAAWLRELTELEIRMGFAGASWYYRNLLDPGVSLHACNASLAERMTQVTGVDIEVWRINDIFGWDLLNGAKYIQDTYPEISLGINSMPFIPPEANEAPWTGYWTWYGKNPPVAEPGGTMTISDPLPSVNLSMQRYKYYLTYLKNYLSRPFDVLCAEVNGWWPTGFTWKDTGLPPTPADWQKWITCQLNYAESVALTEAGNIHAWGIINECGLIPYYCGASTCGHVTPPPDIFNNTGNEIILLKDVGAASTHDITVASSLDPLTHEDYTLTLSPNRGTIIGPYPLDEYGALPTITYDNTNLYVSVLKVEPTA